MKNILKFILNILTIFIFAILIIVIFAKVKMMVTGSDYFEMFGYSIFEVTTGSMEPTIKENDIILVKESDSYVKDDIVTYKSNDAYITHRIINESNDIVVTKGDANNTSDEAINKDAILGKVIKKYSNLGIWQKIFTTPKIIISIFITLILFDFAFSYKKDDKIKIKEIRKTKDKPIKEAEIKELKQKAAESDLDYTIRLDLSEVQKEIENKIRKKK